MAEGDSGQVEAVFTVTKSGPSVATTLDYTTQDGTALAGSDYVATSGTLPIPADALQASIAVKVNGDTEVEPDEAFSIRISNPSVGFTVAPDTGQGTVLNDDQVPRSPASYNRERVAMTPSTALKGTTPSSVAAVKTPKTGVRATTGSGLIPHPTARFARCCLGSERHTPP